MRSGERGLFLVAVNNEGYKSLTSVEKIKTEKRWWERGEERARERGMERRKRGLSG